MLFYRGPNQTNKCNRRPVVFFTHNSHTNLRLKSVSVFSGFSDTCYVLFRQLSHLLFPNGYRNSIGILEEYVSELSVFFRQWYYQFNSNIVIHTKYLVCLTCNFYSSAKVDGCVELLKEILKNSNHKSSQNFLKESPIIDNYNGVFLFSQDRVQHCK